VDKTEKERSDEVLRARMDRNPVDVVLVETGRLRSGSPVCGGTVASVVLSLDGWWGPPPPKQWNTRRIRIRHDLLGGVTEGEFTVYVAYKGELAGFDWCANLNGVPEKLMHVLECTGTRRKVPIPTETREGWTVEGRLNWEDRFNKVMMPTVFDKTKWVVRRLGLKELRAVLDVPAMMECGTELREKLKEMKAPGKMYVCLLDKVLRANTKRRWKRPRMVSSSQADTMKATEKCADEKRPPSSLLGLGSDEKTRREPERRTTNSDKAVKADDAVVPTFL
jgi:hypothetical protein